MIGRDTSSSSPQCFNACLVASLMLLVVAFAQWWLIDWLTPFLMPILYLVVLACFGAVFMWSMVSAIRKRPRSVASLAVCTGTLLIWTFVPFSDLWVRANYWYYRDARDVVVARVLAGSLRPNVEHNSSLITLPPGTPQVSMSGNQIVVEEHDGRKLVFFYTFRGILDNYAGFLFVPKDANPLSYSDLGEPCCTQFVKYSDRWFWVSHQ